jgi:hypothetical protein
MRVSLSLLALIVWWLLPAPSASAATRVEAGLAARPSDTRTIFGHPARHLGPLTQSIARRAGLGAVVALMRCGTVDDDDDDNDAIQDEAPAARNDSGDAAVPVLQALGTLASSRVRLPSYRNLSRRSPRGPPIF